MIMRSQFNDLHHCEIFIHCHDFLIKSSEWSEFHVNIITGSGVMTIFFFKGLTRNPGTGYTLV